MKQERLAMFATVDADGMVTIPPEMLLALGWKVGDTLLCRPGDGVIRFVVSVHGPRVTSVQRRTASRRPTAHDAPGPVKVR
jgi:hypothetical protein